MNEFEKRIADIPPRRLPAAWRDDILVAARSELAAQPAPSTARPWWLEWLWPHPVAWGTLAAAWIVIFALHAATPAPSTTRTAASSGNALNLLLKRQREMAALLATSNDPVARKADSPRSECRRGIISA